VRAGALGLSASDSTIRFAEQTIPGLVRLHQVGIHLQ
jgi:hypothetical protein